MRLTEFQRRKRGEAAEEEKGGRNEQSHTQKMASRDVAGHEETQDYKL